MGFFSSLIDFAGDMYESMDEEYTKPRTTSERIVYAKTQSESNAIKMSAYLDAKYAAEDRMEREKDPRKKRKMKDLIASGIYNLDAVFGPESI